MYQFLGLDDALHELPDYDPALFQDEVAKHRDSIPETPSMWDFLHLPKDEKDALTAQQNAMIGELALQSRIFTIDAHPLSDDAKAAIVAIVNAMDWKLFHRVYSEWVAASKTDAEITGENPEGESGEG